MNVIDVKNIKKGFNIYYDKGSTLKEKILFQNRSRHEVHQVLKGISMTIGRGEAVGLIGENGCGKSTFLKLLSKIIYPNEGTIKITGKVSSLLELGAGFHPDMTGLENIYMNASIFGLSHREISERVQTIIDFSELGEFVDNPVRTYSSGMYMRLAFAVAINVDADILLVDEILAVGDANFQAKCFSKLREIKAAGTTIVIVSHSLGQIEQICDRTIWIKDGLIEQDGSPRDVHVKYLDFMGQKRNDVEQQHLVTQKLENEPEKDKLALPFRSDVSHSTENKTRWGSGDAQIISVKLLNANDEQTHIFKTGEPMTIQIAYQTKMNLKNPAIGIGVFRNDGLQCYGTNTQIDGMTEVKLGAKGVINCLVEHNTLIEGEYLLDVAIHTEDGFAYDYYKEAQHFKTYGTVNDVGVVHLDHIWNIH